MFCQYDLVSMKTDYIEWTHTFIATGNCSCDELAKVKGSICGSQVGQSLFSAHAGS